MYVREKDIKKLIYYPIDFAIQMENYQIDYVLGKFLDVRNVKYKYKEDLSNQNGKKNTKPEFNKYV